MSRTNLDLDQRACATVMRGHHPPSKRAAVNFPLRQLAPELSVQAARGLKGPGWDPDLAQLRQSRLSPS